MDDYFFPQIEVTADGSGLPEEMYDRLTDVSCESSLQLPDQVRLQFIDEHFELYDRAFFTIGARVVVAVTRGGRPRQIADCEVTSIGMEVGAHGRMMLVVSALGSDHRLARGVRLETYVDQTDSEIVSAVASSVGLTSSVASTSTRYPYVMQAAPCNRFLDERASLIGYRWWVEGDTLHFKPAPPNEKGPTLTWAEDLLDLRVMSSSAEANPSVNVRAWNPDTQEAIVGSASSRVSIDSIGTDAPGPTANAREAQQLARFDRFQATRPTQDTVSANDLAEGLASTAAEQVVLLRGTTIGDPRIRAGGTVTITNVGDKLAGTYRIATVEHVYGAADGYRTRFSTGGRNGNGLVDLLGRDGSPAPWDANSLVIGVVTNIDDPERPARVKVKLPTFSDTFESAWARLVLPGAGTDRGLQVYPEVDDEVLVGFEHGDPTRPVVLGGLWSKARTAPRPTGDVVAEGAVTRRTWKSRAGHSITINDDSQSDEHSVVVELADNKTKLTIAQDGVTLTTPSDITVTTDKGASFTAKQDVVIKGANVKIQADQALDLSGSQLSAKGESQASLEGASVSVKAQAQLALEAAGNTQVKGAMVQLN